MPGELKKLKIKAKDKSGKELVYLALVNPETYVVRQTVNYNPSPPPQGNPGKNQQYNNTSPPAIQFDLIFDSTGVIPKPLDGLAGALSGIPIAGAIAAAVAGAPKYDILAEIEAFKNIVLTYDGDIHEPRDVQILWGTLSFTGKLTSLQFNYKLFQPDGTPIRAVATAAFSGSIEDNLREALKKSNSPDLTHIRKVAVGDTLSSMTYKIYGDASYYVEVARINKLVNFRNLTPGTEIFFPPINKSK
ncbi:hypothetical protein [Paraflavitalea speifideaquila]|uniref:CIS tube protein n=1 Tax=Paraflavitalea speifideaquila TaxID=3076558 RepID=UPI0028E839D9|nr:hypothetical protein [Paraflavitalea speifideiaquila]